MRQLDTEAIIVLGIWNEMELMELANIDSRFGR